MKIRLIVAAIAVLAAAAGATIAVSLTGSGHARHARHPAVQAAHRATSPAPSATPDANTMICRKFTRLAGTLTSVLGAAIANPTALAATPGSTRAIRIAAGILSSWSRTAAPVVKPQEMISLPLHLLLASQQLGIVAAGLKDPGASGYALSATRVLAEVSADCAALRDR